MEQEWRTALGKMTYGIYVLTTAAQEKMNGMIASWVSQVSHDPPLVMVTVHPSRYSHTLIVQSGAFVLHMLGADRKDFLKRFKGPDPMEKFAGIKWSKGKTGAPILEDCIAWIECRVKSRLSPGNHSLFIGQIVDAKTVSENVAMHTADYDGQYIGDR